MSVEVVEVHSELQLKEAQSVRRQVFVVEQKVPLEDEIDEYESDCRHYMAFFNNVPVGACRWRVTDKGYKLERFAVLKSYRGKKIGTLLVKKVLDDIKNDGHNGPKHLYLHSQLGAVALYEKFNFKKIGEPFSECDIMHYHMYLDI
ncbi:MAG TPA: GNAT family N-acetyltransferase [Cytophagales bacterium]|jgi:predicted GNAT family N-acyltransferase|nr:GNAT family N-acetyltransferase [Cytophagales bacterium]